jgi:hypothetical protein
MAGAIAEIQQMRAAARRAEQPFAMGGMGSLYVGQPSWDVGPGCVSGKPDALADAIAQQVNVGVTHVQLRFPCRSSNELVDQIAAFGAEVLPLTQA